MKKNKTAKTGIIVAILLLAVGFAAITTTLYINGTAVIKPDDENFKKNVIFTDVDVDATAKAAGATATLSEDSKKVKALASGSFSLVFCFELENGLPTSINIGYRKNDEEILKNINVNSRISIEERKDEYEKY